MKHKVIILLAAVLATINAYAYDFEYTYNGQTLYYNITGNNTCEVTYKEKSQNYVSGEIQIPSETTFDGVNYKVLSISEYAFDQCDGLTSIEIPSSVTSIGESGFSGCYNLTSICLPSSIFSIGDSAFRGCRSLTSIDIPSSVTYIGQDAFWFCESLTSIDLPSSITSIADGTFVFCFRLTSINIPSSVTSIGVSAFHFCNLTSIEIPSSVLTIGGGAFSYCGSLTSIEIPSSVTSIGGGAFEYCGSLTSIEIPSSVTSIEVGTFEYCRSLASIEIPSSVTSIGERAFANCSDLTSIEIPSSVTSIGDYAFQNCTSLASIEIPSLVTSIAKYAFSDCSSLTTIEIPSSVTSIDDYAFQNCSSLTSIEIPSSVNTIGRYAFSNCSSLTSIEIPSLVTSIKEGSFQNCSLGSIVIPSSVTSIDWCAFSNCTGLTSIDIPASLRYISMYALKGCVNIKEIYARMAKPSKVSLGYDIFQDISKLSCTLYVPCGCRQSYAEAPQWADFLNIVANISEFDSNQVSLKDSEAYTLEYNYTDIDVNYTRLFNSTNWEPLYLPFDMSYDEWSPYVDIAELYNVRGYDRDDDGTIDEVRIDFNRLTEGSKILPNTPYVIKAKEIGEVTFNCQDKILLGAPDLEGTIECSSTKYTYTLHGIYKEKTYTYSSYDYYLKDGNFHQVGDEKVTLSPYRTYLTVSPKTGGYNDDTNRSLAPKKIVLVVDGEEDTNGIDDIFVTTPNDGVYYDLMGRRVPNPTTGLYIQNGRKVYIK